MRLMKLSACATLTLTLATFGVCRAAAQGDTSAATPTALATPSAITERRMRVARDADGRVVIDHQLECPSESPAAPWCGTHEVVLFDPRSLTITPWLYGANAGPAATTLKLTSSQIQNAIASQFVPQAASGSGDRQPTVTTEDLGRQVMEGLPVTGVRTTTALPAGYSGNEALLTLTRDVWTSAEMKLVVKVVTHDPRTGETTSVLENISRQPDPALFLPPPNYSVNSTNDQGSEFADFYVKKLADAIGN
jgi:hypothetical protein